MTSATSAARAPAARFSARRFPIRRLALALLIGAPLAASAQVTYFERPPTPDQLRAALLRPSVAPGAPGGATSAADAGASRLPPGTRTRGIVGNMSWSNTASSAAASGAGPAHYCASKAGLMGLTRGMARELAPHRIRVNTVVPGPTNTPMMAGVPEKWAQAIIQGVPLGRMGEPEDIARAALFLASDDSGFVTGQNIAVNGGCVFF